MAKYLEHKGHYGEYKYNAESDCWYGKLIYIEGCVTFEAKNRVELNRAFVDSVEDYIAKKEINDRRKENAEKRRER